MQAAGGSKLVQAGQTKKVQKWQVYTNSRRTCDGSTESKPATSFTTRKRDRQAPLPTILSPTSPPRIWSRLSGEATWHMPHAVLGAHFLHHAGELVTRNLSRPAAAQAPRSKKKKKRKRKPSCAGVLALHDGQEGALGSCCIYICVANTTVPRPGANTPSRVPSPKPGSSHAQALQIDQDVEIAHWPAYGNTSKNKGTLLKTGGFPFGEKGPGYPQQRHAMPHPYEQSLQSFKA